MMTNLLQMMIIENYNFSIKLEIIFISIYKNFIVNMFSYNLVSYPFIPMQYTINFNQHYTTFPSSYIPTIEGVNSFTTTPINYYTNNAKSKFLEKLKFYLLKYNGCIYNNKCSNIWKIYKDEKLHGLVYGCVHKKSYLTPKQKKLISDLSTKLLSETSLDKILNSIKRENNNNIREILNCDEYIMLQDHKTKEKPIITLETIEDDQKMMEYMYSCIISNPSIDYQDPEIIRLRNILLDSGILTLYELEDIITDSYKLTGSYDLHRKREENWFKIIKNELEHGVSCIQMGRYHIPFIIKMIKAEGYDIIMS